MVLSLTYETVAGTGDITLTCCPRDSRCSRGNRSPIPHNHGTFDHSLEEAALDLGCSGFDAFRLVTLPIIAPAVISGWLLAFTLSLDDLVIASFTSGPGATTLPIKIFSAVRLGVSPEINALSTIMIAIVTLGVIIASLVSKSASVRQQRDEQAAARVA